MPDPTVVAQAKEWIDRVDAGRGLSNSWRLQVIQKRFRRRDSAQDTGTALECDGTSCTGLPMRIRRFVPGCPWALVDQAIRYLICKAPYTGIIYNGLEIPGTYRPTLTMWQRDEQSTVDEQKPQNGTYTLIQDLVEEGCEDEETVVTGESCSYVEETEYHWDDSTPGELPGCGDGCRGSGTCQGVTYAIRSNRNEDGTFDWQLVKRTARTQHFGPYAVECNRCTGRVEQETWDNLYGSPTAGFRDHCGSAVAVPSCDSAAGTRTQVQVSENPDCTYKVSVTRRYAYAYSDDWTDGTSCRRRTVVDEHNLTKKPDDPVVGVGQTVRVQLKRNDDCTWDRQVEVIEAPETLDYRWTDGTGCRKRTVYVVKDARVRPTVPAAKTGQTVEADVSRNQDCTWDSRISVREAAKPDWFSWTQGTGCRSEKVTSYSDWTTVPPVPKPSGGRTVSASIRRNEDCTYDGQVTVREPADSTPVRYSTGTPCTKVEEYSVRNAASRPSIPSPAVGQTVQGRITRNDDCLYDASYSVTTSFADSQSWTQGTACRTETVTSYQNWRTRPYVPSPSSGRTVQASIRRNADCTYDGQVSVTRAKASCSSWTEGTGCQPVDAVHCVNSPDDSIPVSPGRTTKVSASVTRNADCTYDKVYKVEHANVTDTGWVTWTSEQKSASGDVARYRNGYRAFKNMTSIPTVSGKHNATVRVSLNEYCLYDGVIEYKDLTDWTNSAAGSGGGIRNGKAKFPVTVAGPGGRPVKTVYEFDVVAFIGSGNEGTEAEYLLRGYVGLGGHGSVRAYRSPEPVNTTHDWWT